MPDEQVMADLDATVAWAKKTGKGDTAKLGITGFCWGGRIVWLYAAHNPDLKAGVAWYGRLVGERRPSCSPSTRSTWSARLKAPVLGLYGEADTGIPVDYGREDARGPQGRRQAGEIVLYPDTPHGFYADYRPSYRKEHGRGRLEADCWTGSRRTAWPDRTELAAAALPWGGVASGHAAGRIGQYPTLPRAMPMLLWQKLKLSVSSPEARAEAVKQLATSKDPNAVELLIEALKDRDGPASMYAAKALGQLGNPRAIPPLVALLRDRDSWMVGEASDALGKIGQAAVASVAALLRDPESHIRELAARTLGLIGVAALEPLTGTLRHSDKRMRIAAAEAPWAWSTIRRPSRCSSAPSPTVNRPCWIACSAHWSRSARPRCRACSNCSTIRTRACAPEPWPRCRSSERSPWRRHQPWKC